MTILLLLVIGSYIGNWNQFKLRNTGLKLKGLNSEHQYIVDATTGNILVEQHVIDIEKERNFVFALRVKALSYECEKTVENKLIFTHYENNLEVAIINLDSKDISFYTGSQFDNWLKDKKLNSSFQFDNFYSNDKKFIEIKGDDNCTLIK